ncbi:MAG: penicillin-binding protein 2 [Rhizobiales bacterium]|nr:penicillin-binding protein 2 [Hyphomicrobiales bacterium]
MMLRTKTITEAAGPPRLAGQNRIRLLGICFALAFAAIGGQLLRIDLMKPVDDVNLELARHQDRIPRPDIVDRNGNVLATDIAVASLYADPRKIPDVDETVELLTAALSDIDAADLRRKLLKPKSAFAWIKRQVSPEERDAVYNLGIPGVSYINERKRVYPQGRLAAHTVGYVDMDTKGIAGIEKYLDNAGAIYTASLADPQKQVAAPAELSVDLRVQHAMTDEVNKAVEKFKALGGGGIILNIETGEVVSLVSLPDYNPNAEPKVFTQEQQNRMLSGVYELGSVIKAVTFAMAFDYGTINMESTFDARFPLAIGSARINDFHNMHRFLSVPEIFTNSSNIGTARMALQVGLERHQEFLRRVGLFDKLETEVPETARPILPKRWSKLVSATAAFGHGFAVQPLQGLSVVAGLLNDGKLIPPTFIKRSREEAEVLAQQIVKPSTSEKMRYLFRLNATEGSAGKADVIGYRIGGKTGTAEKVVNGRYAKGRNLASFIGAFPMDKPKYAILVMLDEPKALPETYGFSTAGWNAVPTAGRIIERVAPILGVAPQFTEADLEKLAKLEKQEALKKH